MWNLIKKDWEKLPQNIRYLFEVGVFLVFNSWVLDHWLPNNELPFKFLGRFDIRGLCYSTGQLFVLVSIVFVAIKHLINFPKLMTNYKTRYPIKDLGKKYDLVWFSGKLVLFDHRNKRYYHVYPWETAHNLDFVSFGVHVEDHFPNPKSSKIKIDKKVLDTTEYEDGGDINTAVET